MKKYREKIEPPTVMAWFNPLDWADAEDSSILHGCRWEGVFPNGRIIYFTSDNVPNAQTEVPIRPGQWLVLHRKSGSRIDALVMSNRDFSRKYELLTEFYE